MPKKDNKKEEEIKFYGPKNIMEGENVFGIAHIYASFNNTFIVFLKTFFTIKIA